ncbi:hypothetical protein [Escherichia phage pEC-M2929-1AR.1]|nr:hypothetical protein [Escherichia phage pEC-M2929-1AR.1]
MIMSSVTKCLTTSCDECSSVGCKPMTPQMVDML